MPKKKISSPPALYTHIDKRNPENNKSGPANEITKESLRKSRERAERHAEADRLQKEIAKAISNTPNTPNPNKNKNPSSNEKT